VSPVSVEPVCYNVKNYGVKGDGSTDDTKLLHEVLLRYKRIYVPSGTYCIAQLDVPESATIRTDGLKTVFEQLPGQKTPTPLIRILGNNVAVGSFTATGNIQTDEGEWMHAVQITADETTGDLSNISLEEVVGKDIRGDVLLLSAAFGFQLSRISAKLISGDNVFRNVVSICGTGAEGGAIRIDRIEGTRIGLYHLDIEPDIGTPVSDVSVGTVRGRNVGFVAPAADVAIKKVEVEELDLDPSYSAGSTPDYPNVDYIRPHGLQIRNADSVKIGTFLARGFNGQAIRYVDSDLVSMALDIEHCQIEDCCRTDITHPAYVLGAGTKATIQIGRLNVAISGNALAALMLANDCALSWVNAALAANTRLLNSCPGARVSNIEVTGDGGNLAINTTGAMFSAGAGSFNPIGYNCDQLQFIGMSIVGDFAGGPADQRHLLQDTTLNGRYYASAVLEPFAKAAAASQIAITDRPTWFSAVTHPLFTRPSTMVRGAAIPTIFGVGLTLSGNRIAVWLTRLFA